MHISPSQVKWWVVGVLGCVWLVFTVVYATWFVAATPMTSRDFEIVRFSFLSISAFGVLFSTLLSSFNALEATRQTADRIRFDKIENSFSFMHKWEQNPLLQARDLMRSIDKQRLKLSAEDILAKVKSEPDLERSIVNCFNFVEEVYLSITAQRVEEQVLKDAFRMVFQANYELFFRAFSQFSNASTTQHVELLHLRWK